MKGQEYYLKSRHPEIRLIQCLPISNKGLKEDFLIFSRQWYDNLPCPVKEGTPSGCPTANLYVLIYALLLFPPFSLLLSECISFCFNGFANIHSTKPLLRLVNRASLDRILQSEVYVNETDSQLKVAHLILGYTPISCAFQAPRCVIKAKDPRLHRISVAYEGFVVPEGIPILESTPFSQPLPVATISAGISSPSLIIQEEEEGEEEGVMDLTDSLDEFEIFNQSSSPKSLPEEMGIQRKPQKSLMELIEDQPGRGDLGSLLNPSFHLLH